MSTTSIAICSLHSLGRRVTSDHGVRDRGFELQSDVAAAPNRCPTCHGRVGACHDHRLGAVGRGASWPSGIRVSALDGLADRRNGLAGALAGIVISSDGRREVAHTSLAVLPDDSVTGATGSL